MTRYDRIARWMTSEILGDVILLKAGEGFSVRGMKNRRFAYNPRTLELMFGGSSINFSSHAQEWYDLRAKGKFDDCARGWIGYGGKYRDGVIYFAPEITGGEFDAGWDTLQMFKRHGATGKTVVRNFVKRGEQTLNEILNPSGQVKVATRPIRIDRDIVKGSVKRLADVIQSAFDRDPDGTLGKNLRFDDEVIVRDVSGKNIQVVVQYRSQPWSSRSFAFGGISGFLKGVRLPYVVVQINGSRLLFDMLANTEFENKVSDILMHELTHSEDVFDTETSVKPQVGEAPGEGSRIGDPNYYYNYPSEVRAYMRNIVEEVYRHLALPWALKNRSVNETVKDALSASLSWKQVSEYMTEQNRHLVMKGVYQAVQDYLADERGKQKAASEILRVATRPIWVDRASVERSVTNLMGHLKSRYSGSRFKEPLEDSLAFADNVIVETTDGRDIEVEVQYRSKRSSSSFESVLGGGSGKTHTTKKPAVLILINGTYTPQAYTTTTSGERFYEEVLSVLMHEVTHQADAFSKSLEPTSQRVLTDQEMDLKTYYNRPYEVRAYMREVFEEVLRYFPSFSKVMSVNESVTRLLKHSDTWQRIKGHLTEKNKDLVLKGVYQAVQDYLERQKVASLVAGEVTGIRGVSFYTASSVETCDRCGAGIKLVALVTWKDGTSKKFGSECINKILAGDTSLKSLFKKNSLLARKYVSWIEVLGRPVGRIPKGMEYYGSGMYFIADDEGDQITIEGHSLFHPDVDLDKNSGSQYRLPEPGEPLSYRQLNHVQWQEKQLKDIDAGRASLQKELTKLESFLARVVEKGILKQEAESRVERLASRVAALLEDYGMARELASRIWNEMGLKQVHAAVKSGEFDAAAAMMGRRIEGNLLDEARRKVPADKVKMYEGIKYKIVFENPESPYWWSNAGYGPDDRTIAIYYNVGLALQLSLLGTFENNKARVLRDIEKYEETVRHEVTHALRDAETKHLTRFIERMKGDRRVREQYQREHDQPEFERDAMVNSLVVLKRRVGKAKWERLSVVELDELMAGNLRLAKNLQGPDGRLWAKRLIREGLVGARMLEDMKKLVV